jgi:predicted phage terminase large subunit-like protein
MQLTAELLEAFAGMFLSPRYDSPQPTPPFHRECWERYCSDHPQCATAAPRNHAKSTGLTHVFILGNALFRVEPYIILVGSTEDMAIEHLGDIATELRENEELISYFGINRWVTEQKTDIIVEMHDGYQFRIIARGAEQRIRGRKWRGRRPGLIVADDIEEDEMCENADRRRKFRNWFFRACKQALRDGGRLRVHGTILHEDSLLNRLMKDSTWNSKLYGAHKGFDDFSGILWPEKYSEKRLRLIRQEFINQGDSAGYAKEYLNDPFDNDDAYLRKADFLPMRAEEVEAFQERELLYYVGCDFAVSKSDLANRSSFTVGGLSETNVLYIGDQYVGRFDTLEWIEVMFDIEARYHPQIIFVEDGVIWKSVAPMLYKEMQKRDIWLNCLPIMPTRDKATRGRPFQKRMRAGGIRFDTQADWYAGYEAELLRFTGRGEAIADDQFDSTAILVKGLESMPELQESDMRPEPDEDELEALAYRHQIGGGQNATTGY